MRYLLDTHTLLWLDAQPDNLSTQAAHIMAAPTNQLFVSLASIWEIQIKSQLGKLDLRVSLEEIIQQQQRVNDVTVFPLNVQHVLRLDALPYLHRDPFDRILIAQALVEDLTIITADSRIAQYPVPVIW